MPGPSNRQESVATSGCEKYINKLRYLQSFTVGLRVSSTYGRRRRPIRRITRCCVPDHPHDMHTLTHAHSQLIPKIWGATPGHAMPFACFVPRLGIDGSARGTPRRKGRIADPLPLRAGQRCSTAPWTPSHCPPERVPAPAPPTAPAPASRAGARPRARARTSARHVAGDMLLESGTRIGAYGAHEASARLDDRWQADDRWQNNQE